MGKDTKDSGLRAALRRWGPLAAIATIATGLLLSGAHRAVTLESVIQHKVQLESFVDQHRLAGAAIFLASYVTFVSLSLPGAVILTFAGGLLFGLWLGLTLTVIGATIGAVIIFIVARSSLGEALRARGGETVQRFRRGFEREAASYLLFVRLVPAFPFALVNLAAAIAGAPLLTFAWTTFVGIIPATFAFTLAATSLDDLLDERKAVYEACLAAGGEACRIDLDLAALINPKLLMAFAALGFVAIIPVLARRFFRKAETSGVSP